MMKKNVKRTIFFLSLPLLFTQILFTLGGPLAAQYRFGNVNPETGQTEGFLPRETYGRFGVRSVRDPMIRNHQNSRFSGNGAIYDERGRWIGIERNPPNARFKNYGSETQRENDAFFNNLLTQPSPEPIAEPAPMLTSTLTADQVIPRYVPTPHPHNALAQITLGVAAAQAQQAQPQTAPTQPGQVLQNPGANNRQSQWFRGGAPQGARQGARQPVPMGTPNRDFRAVGTELAPLLQSDPLPPPLVEMPLTPEQNAEQQRRSQRQIEKGLEEMILRSPDVHLLSPVTVNFANGVATINGLVTTPEAKTSAGEILLAAPGVRQVKNMLSTIQDEQ